jgi:hypothetical protein
MWRKRRGWAQAQGASCVAAAWHTCAGGAQHATCTHATWVAGARHTSEGGAATTRLPGLDSRGHCKVAPCTGEGCCTCIHACGGRLRRALHFGAAMHWQPPQEPCTMPSLRRERGCMCSMHVRCAPPRRTRTCAPSHQGAAPWRRLLVRRATGHMHACMQRARSALGVDLLRHGIRDRMHAMARAVSPRGRSSSARHRRSGAGASTPRCQTAAECRR